VADPNYSGRDWQAIALVIELGPRRRMYGYVYARDGDCEAETPDSFEPLFKAAELRDRMRKDTKADWSSCLVTLTRPGPQVRIEFDYDGSGKWAVTPGNAEVMAEALRPR